MDNKTQSYPKIVDEVYVFVRHGKRGCRLVNLSLSDLCFLAGYFDIVLLLKFLHRTTSRVKVKIRKVYIYVKYYLASSYEINLLYYILASGFLRSRDGYKID